MSDSEDIKQKYAVVYFYETKEFSEIPTSWLCNNSTCWWPVNSKNTTALMRSDVKPDPLTWKKYKIEIKFTTDSFKKARNKAEVGEFNPTTDEEDLGRGKRKKKPTTKTFSISGSSDNSVISSEDAPSLSSFEANLTITGNNCGTTNPTQDRELSAELKMCAITSTPVISEIKSTSLDEIKQICLSTNLLLRDIQSRLIQLESQFHGGAEKVLHDELDEIFKFLPIKSVDELNTFEDKLNDELFNQKFKSFLLSIGGKTGKENITRCLKTIYSNGFALGCSWLGHRNNYKVSNLKSIAVLKGSILSSYKDIKLSDFEYICAEWFRLAKLRYSREQKTQDKV